MRITTLSSAGVDLGAVEDSSVASANAAGAAAEEEIDPVQSWVQATLGSFLELAACNHAQADGVEGVTSERLIPRGTMILASAVPLSPSGAGQMSAQRELEVEVLEVGQRALVAGVRGWFARATPHNI
ncbi:MAG: hypothetical protein GY772_01810 [bacterium]|nr:hypothetical protein [bacterium]